MDKPTTENTPTQKKENGKMQILHGSTLAHTNQPTLARHGQATDLPLSVVGVSESPDPPACRTSKRMCVYVHLCLCVCASVRVCVCASVRSVCVHVVCVAPPPFLRDFFFAMFHMNVHSRAGMLGFIVVPKRCLWFNRLNRDLLFCKRILLVTVNIHDITVLSQKAFKGT